MRERMKQVLAVVLTAAMLLSANGYVLAAETAENAISENILSENAVSANIISDDSTADQTAGEDSASDDMISDDTISDDTISDDTISDDTISDDTISDDTISDDTISDDTISDNTIKVMARPGSYDIYAGDAIPKFGLEFNIVIPKYVISTNIEPKFSCSADASSPKGDYDIIWTNMDEVSFNNVPAGYSISKNSVGTLTIQESRIAIEPIDNQEYTGAAIKPDVSVTFEGEPLTVGTDYTVQYKNNVKVGSATAEVTGKTYFTSTVSADFSIVGKDIGSDSITASSYVYVKRSDTKDPHAESRIWLKNDGKKLVKNTDYTVAGLPEDYYKSAGDYSLSVNGINNYSGSRTITVEVVDENENLPSLKSITAYSVKFGDIDYEKGDNTYTKPITSYSCIYSGSAAVPDGLTVYRNYKENGETQTETLSQGSDYTLVYKNNTGAGTAKVLIYGQGLYTGCKTVSFKIKKADLRGTKTVTKEEKYNDNGDVTGYNTVVTWDSPASITVEDATYVKGGAKPAVTVELNGTTLVQGRDYTVSYKGNNKEGEGAAVYKKDSEGNDTDTVTGYTGPQAIVKGKGNYTGSLTQVFSIGKGDLSNAIVIVPTVIYKAKAGNFKITPTLIDPNNGRTLVAGCDYSREFEYSLDSKAAAEAGAEVTVTINEYSKTIVKKNSDGDEEENTVTGPYTGSVSATYKILSAADAAQYSIAKAKVQLTASGNKKSYTGQNVELTDDDLLVTAGKGSAEVKLSMVTDENTDGYMVYAYLNNVHIGRALAYIKGCGKYTGMKAVAFKIGAYRK